MRGERILWIVAWIVAWAAPLLLGVLAGSDAIDGVLRHAYRTELPGTLHFDYYFHRFYLQMERIPLIVLAGFAFAAPFVARLARRDTRRVSIPPGAVAVLAVATLVVTSLIAVFVLENFPNSADEWAYRFTARSFAEGELYRPADLHPLAADLYLNHYVFAKDGKVFGIMFPGWPVILAAGILSGVPWLINPILGALTVLLVYRTGREMYDREVGLSAAVLCAASPFFLLNSASYFSQPTGLLCTAAALFLFQRSVRRSSAGTVALCGLCLGYVFFTRPLTGLALTIPTALWGIRLGWRTRGLAWYILGFLPPALATLAVNRAITGHALVTPYVFAGNKEVPGFFADGYAVHTPWDGVIQAVGHTVDLHAFLLFGSLLLIVPVVLSGKTWREYLLLSLPACLALGYWTFVSYGGNQYGPRYYYAGLAPLCLVLSLGLSRARERFGRGPVRLVAVVALVLNLGLVAYYLAVSRRIVHERTQPFRMAAGTVTNGIVFLETGAGTMELLDLHRNDPCCDGPVIWAFHPGYLARSLGPDAARAYHGRIVSAFPGRTCWVYRYGRPGARGSEQEVVAWPPPREGEYSELRRVDCLDLSVEPRVP